MSGVIYLPKGTCYSYIFIFYYLKKPENILSLSLIFVNSNSR